MSSPSAKLRNAVMAWDCPTSLAGRARARRWEMVEERFPDFRDMRVLDLGGVPQVWRYAPIRPAELTVLNLDHYEDDRAHCVVGDACDPPSELDALSFDLVYSNSVIEHVGGFERRKQFAQTVERFAPHHWVQTPARSFLLEPHWLFPCFQFLPVGLRATVAQFWPYSFYGVSDDKAVTLERVLWVELVGAAEMRHLFSGSDILHERFGGLTKSLIAAR